MKDIVIYHANCTDGFGAAFAAWCKLGDTAEYAPVQYGKLDTPPALEAFLGADIAKRTVYILDFSLKKPAMDWLFLNARRVVWLDHHKTAFEMWCPGETEYYATATIGPDYECHILLDNGKSGALLAWEHFHPGVEVPRVIANIDDRDRWQWNLDHSREVHAALQLEQPWSFEQWRTLTHEGAYDGLVACGSTACRVQDAQVSASASKAKKCSIRYAGEDGAPVIADGLAVNTPVHISEVGHELAKASSTYGLIWHLDGIGGKANCSLRSTGDYDVSAIAKQFGGGGHRNAAGFTVPIEMLLSFLEPGSTPPVRLDSTESVLVDTRYHWLPIDTSTPRGCRAFLIKRGAGAATVGTVRHDENFFDHYFPMPVFQGEAEAP